MHYNFTLQENVGIADLFRMGEDEQMERLIGHVAGEELLAKTGGLRGQLDHCHERGPRRGMRRS